jgi:protein gp37
MLTSFNRRVAIFNSGCCVMSASKRACPALRIATSRVSATQGAQSPGEKVKWCGGDGREARSLTTAARWNPAEHLNAILLNTAVDSQPYWRHFHFVVWRNDVE